MDQSLHESLGYLYTQFSVLYLTPTSTTYITRFIDLFLWGIRTVNSTHIAMCGC